MPDNLCQVDPDISRWRQNSDEALPHHVRRRAQDQRGQCGQNGAMTSEVTTPGLNPEDTFCSFCGLPRTRSGPLLGGPGVTICRDCAESAVGRLDGAETRETVEAVRPWADMELPQVLATLPLVAQVEEQADKQLRTWVAVAREHGASWAKIGDALRITRQTAWERFNRGSSAPH